VTADIEINPMVRLASPVFRGTRITVQSVLIKLGEGAADLVAHT
jgi:uncharacterized protein (DUF433 family)